MPKDMTSRLFDQFANLLEYPNEATLREAGLCLEQLKGIEPEAASLLESFYHGMQKRTLEKMQELYTSTFDMQPVCYPYIGYQLFGESYKRGAFMAQLNEAYHSSGHSAGKELPDHVAVILRFLALDRAMQEAEFGRVLLCEGLTPALKKMIEALGKQVDNPYTSVVSALLLILTDISEKEMDHA